MGVLRAISGGGSSDHIGYVLSTNSVRLADAAVRDYMLGRAAVNQMHANRPHTFGISEMLQAATHFESCLWHIERFIKHAKAIRACPSAEPGLKALVPRSATFLKGSTERVVTRIRHMLSHLESEALNGNIPQGTSILLIPQANGLVVSNLVISWDELIPLLEEIHGCAAAISSFKPSTSP